MKISKMSTEQALNVICDVTPHIKAISTDAKINGQFAALAKLGKDKNRTVAQMFTACVNALCELAPVILKEHRFDVYAILANVNQTTPEVIAEQPVIATLKQIKDLVNDEAFRELFT